ncbi:hypothetical protein AAVH_16425 [Aphelenchoides avenae]|nr:hypothetical protein AAVH_16425 [Aphelenchus avenae]
MKLYQRLLTVDASFDFFLSIVAMEAQPVILTGGGYFVYTCSGPFASLWRPLDAWTFLLYAGIMHLNVTWIPTQFLYRYILLCCQDV